MLHSGLGCCSGIWRASGSIGGQERWALVLADPGDCWAVVGSPAPPKRFPVEAWSSIPRLTARSPLGQPAAHATLRPELFFL